MYILDQHSHVSEDTQIFFIDFILESGEIQILCLESVDESTLVPQYNVVDFSHRLEYQQSEMTHSVTLGQF